MVLVDAGRAVLLAGLTVAVLANVATIWLLYIVAFVLGCFETMFDTAASSMLPNVVGKDKVVAANSRLNAVELTMNQFVGPPIGGFLASIAIATAFGTAGRRLPRGAALPRDADRHVPGRAHGPARVDRVGDPRRPPYLVHHRLLRTLALVVGPMNLASTAVFAVLVLYVVAPGPLGLDGVGFGLLLTVARRRDGRRDAARDPDRTAGSAGRTCSSPASPRSWSSTSSGSSSRNPLAIGIILALSSTIGGAFNVVFGSIRQRIVPNHLLGRVMASFRVISWGSLPIGALLGGIIGQTFGLPAVFIGAALIHVALLPSRLILTDAFMAQVEAAASRERGRPAGRRGVVLRSPSQAGDLPPGPNRDGCGQAQSSSSPDRSLRLSATIRNRLRWGRRAQATAAAASRRTTTSRGSVRPLTVSARRSATSVRPPAAQAVALTTSSPAPASDPSRAATLTVSPRAVKSRRSSSPTVPTKASPVWTPTPTRTPPVDRGRDRRPRRARPHRPRSPGSRAARRSRPG